MKFSCISCALRWGLVDGWRKWKNSIDLFLFLMQASLCWDIAQESDKRRWLILHAVLKCLAKEKEVRTLILRKCLTTRVRNRRSDLRISFINLAHNFAYLVNLLAYLLTKTGVWVRAWHRKKKHSSRPNFLARISGFNMDMKTKMSKQQTLLIMNLCLKNPNRDRFGKAIEFSSLGTSVCCIYHVIFLQRGPKLSYRCERVSNKFDIL